MPDNVHTRYECRACLAERGVDGPPVKTRTCPECGGTMKPVEGQPCAQCGGTIHTKCCHVTAFDFSQVRICSDCGAHGVRYSVFGVPIERTAGPAYDASFGAGFNDWLVERGLVDHA